jgi:hypothetical protein
LKTERVQLSRGCYPFMEKHLFDLEDSHCYLQLTLLAETNHPLAQITVFYNKFVSMK